MKNIIISLVCLLFSVTLGAQNVEFNKANFSDKKVLKEALKNIEEAIALCLEVRAERGLPLTIETRQLEVVA